MFFEKCAHRILFCFFLVSPVLFAAGQQETADDGLEIATVVKITGIPWFNRMEEGVKQAKSELGIDSYQIGSVRCRSRSAGSYGGRSD